MSAAVPAYAVANANIAHQRVDDEVIVINLLTGAYFSLRTAAADAWDLLIGGTASAEVGATVAARYAVDANQVGSDLAAFVATLVAEGLLGEGAPAQAAPALPAVPPGATYTGIALEKFDDMEELLLLDPIHEVDDAGWPIVATEPTES